MVAITVSGSQWWLMLAIRVSGGGLVVASDDYSETF